MTKRIRMAVGLILAVILPACAVPSTRLPVSNTQAPATRISVLPTQPEIPTIAPATTNGLFSDDFSVESSELEIFSNEFGSAEIKDGNYVMHSSGELWKWGRSNSEFSDTVIEFDTTITKAPTNNNAASGVICRMKTHENNTTDGYLFAISGDGFYSIQRITSSAMNPLVDWAESDVINQGNQENKVRATCNGSELKLEVNGELLATASADASGPQSGGFAFAAVSFETAEPVTEVHFDNLVVTKP